MNEIPRNEYEIMSPQERNQYFIRLIEMFPTSFGISFDQVSQDGRPYMSFDKAIQRSSEKTYETRGIVFSRLKNLAPYMRVPQSMKAYILELLDHAYSMGIPRDISAETFSQALLATPALSEIAR